MVIIPLKLCFSPLNNTNEVFRQFDAEPPNLLPTLSKPK